MIKALNTDAVEIEMGGHSTWLRIRFDNGHVMTRLEGVMRRGKTHGARA